MLGLCFCFFVRRTKFPKEAGHNLFHQWKLPTVPYKRRILKNMRDSIGIFPPFRCFPLMLLGDGADILSGNDHIVDVQVDV